jgi:hypothetical protein
LFDPTPFELRGAGYEVSFSSMGSWHLSSGHRTLSWLDCPGVPGPDCVSRSVDLDMGAEDDGGDPACWPSGEFADLNRILTCRRWWGGDGASWLEVSQVGETERVDLPSVLPDGAHFTKAFFGDGIVAEIAFPDGTTTVGAYRDGEWEELLPMPDLPPTRLLGVARDGQDVRTLVLVDGDGDRGGVWAVDADGASRLVPVVPSAAQMWTGAFDLDAAATHAIGADLPDDREGWTFGIVRGADPTARTITLDEAEWLTGESARAAHEAETGDPDGPPNDYFVRNVDRAESTYPVSAEATIQVMDPTDVSTTLDGDLADVQETVERFGDWGLYWLRIEDGVVTAIEWQYTP